MLQAWVSPVKVAVEDDPPIITAVVEQRWGGLVLKDFGEPKGKGEERMNSTMQNNL